MFQESILKERFPPSGQIEGFTAEIGASGSYCPQHVTLPVNVSYFAISEHSAPLPFLVSVPTLKQTNEEQSAETKKRCVIDTAVIEQNNP